jgi:chlorite dismutase
MAESPESTGRRRGPEPPDLSEKGGNRNGVPQRSDERLFMQLLVFGDCHDARPLAQALDAAGVTGALYEDVNDPRGVGLLTVTQDPNELVDRVRPVLNGEPFASLAPKPEYTMLGRTYSLGYEPDLADALIHRPKRTVLNRDWQWAVWYPLRRSGRFSTLPADEQRVISRTTSASPVMASTRTTTTSSSACSARSSFRFRRSCRR